MCNTANRKPQQSQSIPIGIIIATKDFYLFIFYLFFIYFFMIFFKNNEALFY